MSEFVPDDLAANDHRVGGTAADPTRKRAIQILEFFDRIAFLRRVGDIHLLRPGTLLFPAKP